MYNRSHTMGDIKKWAREYRSMGLALARIKPGEKRPTDRKWTLRSKEPDEFRDDDSIGIQSGRLSGDVVCLDIDNVQALELADRYLPPTGMVEGRPGKPKSHLWYRVSNIPAELTALPT